MLTNYILHHETQTLWEMSVMNPENGAMGCKSPFSSLQGRTIFAHERVYSAEILRGYGHLDFEPGQLVVCRHSQRVGVVQRCFPQEAVYKVYHKGEEVEFLILDTVPIRIVGFLEDQQNEALRNGAEDFLKELKNL